MSSGHLTRAASFDVGVCRHGTKIPSLVQENIIIRTKEDYVKLNHEYMLDIRKKVPAVV